MVSEGHPYICTRIEGPRGRWASHPCEGACQRGGPTVPTTDPHSGPVVAVRKVPERRA